MNLIKNFRIRIILISFFIIMTVSLVSCSDTATEKTNVAENQSSANDVFKTATGNTNPKTETCDIKKTRKKREKRKNVKQKLPPRGLGTRLKIS